MQLGQKKKTLIDYINLKLRDEDWAAVKKTAQDLRDIEAAIKLLGTQNITDDFNLLKTGIRDDSHEKSVPLQAVPPVQLEIPHHLNEVTSILKMSDEELVDQLFPDYTQHAEGE